MTTHKLLISTFVSLILVFSISGCDSDCDKCDEAIQHMYGKIEQNYCNTSYMENAANRIREDCKDIAENPELYIKLMAESCCEQRLILPICEVTNGIPVDLWFYHWTNDPGGVPNGMWVEIPGLSEERFLTTENNPNARVIKQFELPEGKKLTFNFFNNENDVQPALTAIQTLTYYRTGGFSCPTREVTLKWDQATSKFSVKFFDWD